jgi:hypothetical protein
MYYVLLSYDARDIEPDAFIFRFIIFFFPPGEFFNRCIYVAKTLFRIEIGRSEVENNNRTKLIRRRKRLLMKMLRFLKNKKKNVL